MLVTERGSDAGARSRAGQRAAVILLVATPVVTLLTIVLTNSIVALLG